MTAGGGTLDDTLDISADVSKLIQLGGTINGGINVADGSLDLERFYSQLPDEFADVPRTGLRQQYIDAVAGLKGIGEDLLKQGLSKEEVARRLHGMRRQLGVKFKEMTPPDLLEYIHKFNIDRYGDKLGPTFESLIAKGKSFDQIIGSASRPLGDMKQLGAALHKHFGDEILPFLKKYDMLP